MSNLLRVVAICAIAASLFPARIAAQPLMANSGVADSQSANIERLARLMTVRILTPTASGSGAIVRRQGQVYTVLTSWHVVAFSQQHTIIAPDGQKYRLLGAPLQLGNADLAIVQFRSSIQYQVTRISTDLLTVGEPVFAAGFPMYRGGSSTTTFDQGIRAFRFTQGIVSVLPPKSLAQGYRLGYTNDIAVGMSGGPIFNSQGLLIGINGRVKNRDPDFGVYAFEDGTEPSGRMLEQMVNSSWGIPISTYLRFISPYSSSSNYPLSARD
ncbi:serine protease [Microcoleus sp. N3A4]|uniref:serine protease n=1 Tax=Microcoleus sp. N3A4 TaxID=3055379 RepID=UPI002FCF9218